MRLRASRDAKHAVDVLIYRTKTEMREAANGYGGDACERTEGYCQAFWRSRDGGPFVWGCRVYLYAGQAGSGIVSHELTHAALFYCTRGRRRGEDRISYRRLNERLAWTQGWLVHQFWRAYYRKPKAVQRAIKGGGG